MDKKETTKKVTEKFWTLRELTQMVGQGFSNSLLVCGPGGMGKSYTVLETLAEQDINYQMLRGFASPAAFYNFLYEHSDELIVIDDCDNIFKDMTGLNILKAVLETAEIRRVAWISPSPLVDIDQFDFTGRIIFLTNLNLTRLSKHMEALLTRVHVYRLDLTPGEVLQRMKHIAIHYEYKGVKKPDRLKVVRYIRDQHDHIPGLNIRHYVKALDLMLYSRTQWRKLLMECVGNGSV